MIKNKQLVFVMRIFLRITDSFENRDQFFFIIHIRHYILVNFQIVPTIKISSSFFYIDIFCSSFNLVYITRSSLWSFTLKMTFFLLKQSFSLLNPLKWNAFFFFLSFSSLYTYCCVLNLNYHIFFYSYLFAVCIVAVDLTSSEDIKDTREGEDVTLECRFAPQNSRETVSYYWTKNIKQIHDNVAVGNVPLGSNYK